MSKVQRVAVRFRPEIANIHRADPEQWYEGSRSNESLTIYYIHVGEAIVTASKAELAEIRITAPR